jgi:very-short-patch-repair endonuclease
MGRRPTPLPESLGGPAFTTSAALDRGVPRGRLARPDLRAPFHGIRIDAAAALDVPARAAAYALKLGDETFFSHSTAAVLHGMWLPSRLQRDEVLDVSVFRPRQAPGGRGVRGHQLERRAQRILRLAGLPVLESPETWCQLAPVLTVDDLVVAGDWILQHGVPEAPARLRALQTAVALPGRRGRGRLVQALPLLRPGVRSPQETRLRLLLLRGSLPEPRVNLAIRDGLGRFLAEGDLVYPDTRTLLEYEGDLHRTDQQIFRKDILRRERLMDAGWWTIRITADDLALHPDETVERVRRTLLRRAQPRRDASDAGYPGWIAGR